MNKAILETPPNKYRVRLRELKRDVTIAQHYLMNAKDESERDLFRAIEYELHKERISIMHSMGFFLKSIINNLDESMEYVMSIYDDLGLIPKLEDIGPHIIVKLKPRAIMNERRMKEYNEGYTDEELALLWGRTLKGVYSWRWSRGLKGNKKSEVKVDAI